MPAGFSIKRILRATDLFWTRHPALLYGLSALLSFSFIVDGSKESLALLLLILLTSCASMNKGPARFACIGAASLVVMAYASTLYRLPDLPTEGMQGTAVFEPGSISLAENHFGKAWTYQGICKAFYTTGGKRCEDAKNFPLSIRISISKNSVRPSADRAFLVKGTLKKSGAGNYLLSIKGKEPWEPILGTSSLAELRFRMKQQVKSFLGERIGDPRSAEFLAGIATGQFEDRIMRSEFSKLGLQHLMAISGFHFALLAMILAFFLKLFLPQKTTAAALILLMTAYFFFLGASPSIARAWTMSVVTLAGFLFEKRALALNSLGASFLFILLFDPLLARTIGFQFSAAVTASILIFYPLAKAFLENVIPVRNLSVMRKMSWLDRHCYVALSLLREGLALSLAVNIVAVPMTLYTFQQFPLAGVIYNLFTPFLVSAAMFLTAVAALFHFLLPPLGSAVFYGAASFTRFVLTSIYQFPSSLSVYLRLEDFPLSLLISYLAAAFLMGIAWQTMLGKNKDPLPALSLI